MIYCIENNELEISLKETLRYMGCVGNADEKTTTLAKATIKEMSELMTLKSCYEKYPVKITDDVIDFGFTTFKSKDLAKNLSGCGEAILFVATIGIETDRKISKYSITEPSKGIAYQGAGAAAIEEWCNMLCEYFKEQGNTLCPRFSPGYGDLSLTLQKDIINALDATKKIGVSLTDSMLMLPAKSVSAIVGIKK